MRAPECEPGTDVDEALVTDDLDPEAVESFGIELDLDLFFPGSIDAIINFTGQSSNALFQVHRESIGDFGCRGAGLSDGQV